MECELCGFPWPLDDLTVQTTETAGRLKRCPHCVDNTDNEERHRERMIADILKATAKHEAQDHRDMPQLWFQTADVEN
jgi:hypothetical protein